MRLKDRVAIVTGGASGIGKATALLFAREGAKVAVFDIWEQGGESVVKEIEGELGGQALFAKCDVAQEVQVAAAVQRVIEAFGRIDILYNNAGGGISPDEPPRPVDRISIDELTEKEWNKTIDSHLKGCFLCSKHVVKQLKKQGGGGAIVSTSSIAGLVGLPYVHAYGAAKHGIAGLTKEMALELADHGIRVNAVAPGAINTNMLRRNRPDLTDEVVASIRDRYPMKRPGKPEDIAQGVLYLVSDDAEFVTGTILNIDGGYLAR